MKKELAIKILQDKIGGIEVPESHDGIMWFKALPEVKITLHCATTWELCKNADDVSYRLHCDYPGIRPHFMKVPKVIQNPMAFYEKCEGYKKLIDEKLEQDGIEKFKTSLEIKEASETLKSIGLDAYVVKKCKGGFEAQALTPPVHFWFTLDDGFVNISRIDVGGGHSISYAGMLSTLFFIHSQVNYGSDEAYILNGAQDTQGPRDPARTTGDQNRRV